MLRDAGFDDATAAALSQLRRASDVEQQIRWLPLRNVQKNELGFLRRAIEENWAKPSTHTVVTTRKRETSLEQEDNADDEKQRRLEQRDALAREWEALQEQQRDRLYAQAIARRTSVGRTL